MGRIITSVTVGNTLEPKAEFRFDGLVDTGASHLVLPDAWRERLGPLESIGKVSLELANQERAEGEICGPVKIQLEGFRPIYSEVIFLPMKAINGRYEPLIGYIVLEQSQAAVDFIGHRLVHVKYLDLKLAA